MKIVLDHVDGAIYGDIVLSSSELDAMRMGEMIDACTTLNHKKYYIGVRVNSLWDDEEDDEEDENEWFY